MEHVRRITELDDVENKQTNTKAYHTTDTVIHYGTVPGNGTMHIKRD